MSFTKADWNAVERLLNKARNKELYEIEEMVQHEIHLSEECIEEGTEKR